MHFKHPELLYMLFLLVIPVLVHLFRLRRFRSEPFTNVKFLQKAVLQTRRGSQLKKRLILLTRLLLLAAVIMAFAQPYLPSSQENSLREHTVVYLDNSFSMQARGEKGILLRQSVQQLLEQLPDTGTLSLFTNDLEYRGMEMSSLKDRLQHIGYSSKQLDWETVRVRAEEFFGEAPANNSFLAISDFQKQGNSQAILPVSSVSNYLVQMQPEERSNVSVDSVHILSRNPEEIDLRVELSASGTIPEEISVGLSDGTRLLSRKTAAFQGAHLTMDFTLPALPIEHGQVQIEDRGLSFDNRLYFSINKTRSIRVLVIGNQENSFLRRIFTTPDFDLQFTPAQQVDYSVLSGANLVILNELNEIPASLKNELLALRKEQVVLVLIPSSEASLDFYNDFLEAVSLPAFSRAVEQERLITTIHFDHPLYASVFEEKVQNFQYPHVASYYSSAPAVKAVLSYDNGQPFLMEKELVFVFTAPLNLDNSNFQASPLIVPTFYSMGNLSLAVPQLYYTLGTEERIELPLSLEKDEILRLERGSYSFIPRQQSFQNKVQFSLKEASQEPGHFELVRDSLSLMTLGLNVDRKESDLIYHEIKAAEGTNVLSAIPEVFEEIRSAAEVTALWKWFIIFALIFVLIEMLILKYLK